LKPAAPASLLSYRSPVGKTSNTGERSQVTAAGLRSFWRGFGSGSDRDEYIGGDAATRPKAASDRQFAFPDRPWVRVPPLASHLLSGLARRLDAMQVNTDIPLSVGNFVQTRTLPPPVCHRGANASVAPTRAAKWPSETRPGNGPPYPQFLSFFFPLFGGFLVGG